MQGPSSSLLKPKLKEMDDAIKYTWEGIQAQDSIRGGSTLFLLVSDHGMTDRYWVLYFILSGQLF